MAKRGQTKQLILAALGQGPQTSYGLANIVNQPQPSVRQTIGKLRAEGFNIVTSGTGLNATYTLVITNYTVPQADGDDGSAFFTDIDAGDEDIDDEGKENGW